MRDRYVQDAELFLEAVLREDYLASAALKDTLEISKIYERFGWLFEKPVVLELLADRSGKERRYLADFAAGEYLRNAVTHLTEQIARAEAAATVHWQGRTIACQRTPGLLANEPDARRRHDLEQLTLPVIAGINPLRQERMETLHSAALSLGLGDYTAALDDLRALHLRDLAARAHSYLATTAHCYFDHLPHFLGTVGVEPEEATNVDFLHLFRATCFDALFPKQRLMLAFRQTMSCLGIDIKRQVGLHLDTKARPRKLPRAFCAPIRIPHDIMLVIMPRGGVEDYRSLFHEGGHAQHFLHVRPEQPIAYRRLGDVSLTEGYGFLFDHLVQNPRWLSSILEIADPYPYVRLARFYTLRMTRRYAAKLLYELELHAAGDMPAAAARYAGILGAALGQRVWPQEYLADVDDGYYVARYLRGWIFEVQLRRRLEEAFGEDWFCREAAGDFLKQLFAHGQEFTVEEILQQLGYDGLDDRPLVDDLTCAD